MRHIQGFEVMLEQGGLQYEESLVPEDRSLWLSCYVENTILQGRFNTYVSQVAIHKQLANPALPELFDLGVRFYSDFNFYSANAVQLCVCINHKQVLEERKYVLWREDFVDGHVSCSLKRRGLKLPAPWKDGAKGSKNWKRQYAADSGSVTVFISRGKADERYRGETDEMRRKAIDSFKKLRRPNGETLCFEFQVRPQGFRFAAPQRENEGAILPDAERTNDLDNEEDTEFVRESAGVTVPRRDTPGEARPGSPDSRAPDGDSSTPLGAMDMSSNAEMAHVESASTQAMRSSPVPDQSVSITRQDDHRSGAQSYDDASKQRMKSGLPKGTNNSSLQPAPSVSSEEPPPSTNSGATTSQDRSHLRKNATSTRQAAFIDPSILSPPRQPTSTRPRPKPTGVDLTQSIPEGPAIKPESGHGQASIDLTADEPEIIVVKTECKSDVKKRRVPAVRPIEVEEDDEEDLRLELRKIDLQQRLNRMMKRRERKEGLKRELR